MKKYELTNDTIKHFGRTLYRIKALRNIPYHGVKAGDLGGYIEKEDNLSHNDDCWVDDNAWVYDNAEVSGNARVFGDARVGGNACVFGKARVFGDAIVCDNAKVYDDAIVYDDALVCDYARVGGNTYLDSGLHTGEETEQDDNNKHTKPKDVPTSLTHGIVKQTNEGWQNLPDDKAYPILMTTHDNRETAIVKERFRLQWVYECGHKEPINEDDKWYSHEHVSKIFNG